jgi:hypothetical protein
VFAQTIVEAPKYGASRRAAAISIPRLQVPTAKTSAGSSRPSGAQQLLLQPRPVPGRDRPLGPLLVQGDAAILRQVEQALLLDPLPRGLEEDPGEQAEGEEGALDHHHHAGGALVGDRADPPVALARGIDRVEHRARPHQDVAEDRAGEAHGDHIADFPGRREPLRHRQRPEDRHPHQAAEKDEHAVLERVHRRPAIGGVVEGGDVPDEEVEHPEREGDRRVGEHPQAIEDRNRQDRLQQRAGEAEDEQQGGDVTEHQVLDHVGDHQLLGEMADRRDQRRDDEEQSRREAELAPDRHRAALASQGRGALRVEAGHEQQRQQLQGCEDAGHVGDRQGH